MRDKSRDLFDFGAILKNQIFTKEELVVLFSKIDNNLYTIKDVINLLKSKKESKDDEAVYLSEKDKIHLSFEEIKEQVIKNLLYLVKS